MIIFKEKPSKFLKICQVTDQRVRGPQVTFSWDDIFLGGGGWKCPVFCVKTESSPGGSLGSLHSNKNQHVKFNICGAGGDDLTAPSQIWQLPCGEECTWRKDRFTGIRQTVHGTRYTVFHKKKRKYLDANHLWKYKDGMHGCLGHKRKGGKQKAVFTYPRAFKVIKQAARLRIISASREESFTYLVPLPE